MTNQDNEHSPPPADERSLAAGFYLGDYLVEPLKGVIGNADGSQRLEPKVMDVLQCLAANAGQVVRREDLLEQVWGDVVVSEEVLTRCISELRSVLGDTGKPRSYIQTLPKRGYRLLTPVRSLENASPEALSSTSASIPDTAGQAKRWLIPGLVAAVVLLTTLVLANKPALLDVPGSATPITPVASSAGQGDGQDLSNSGRRTVAVLPFVNLTDDTESGYFANGLTADIRNTLVRASNDSLKVVARTSSEAFRGQAIDIRTIGAQLSANIIVEGTVRIVGERVRVTAQLTSADDGFPVWADRFEYSLEDSLVLQSEIADRIVEQLLPEQLAAEHVGQRQANLKAYDYYLLGRHRWNMRTPEALEQADAYFRQALELDPNNALALSGLSDALILKEAYGGSNPDNAIQRAQTLVDRALELQPDLAEAHASQGAINRHINDNVSAEAAYRRAIALRPSYSMGRMWLGNVLLEQNRVTEAFEHFQAALDVDPLNQIVRQNHIRALGLMGRYQEVDDLAQRYLQETYSDHFLKMWMFTMLNAGRYDDVLNFAVRNNFSENYAVYSTEIVLSALIALQRYSDAKALYEQIRADLSARERAWLLAMLGEALRDPDQLREASLLLAGSGRDQPADSKQPCDGGYINFWRAVAAHIEEDYSLAESLLSQALQFSQEACMGKPVVRAEMQAYFAHALRAQGADQQAAQITEAALDNLADIINQGRAGRDITISQLSLAIVAGDEAQIARLLRQLNTLGWQYYAELAKKPLFDSYLPSMRPQLANNASQFAQLQQRSRNINMAKFGI